MILKDAMQFKVKPKDWENLKLEGENLFTKIKDVTGDLGRIRKFANKDKLTILNFETLHKLWKENKIEIIQGDLDGE